MKIKIGFEIAFEAPQPTPMVILLNVHPSRQSDLLTSDQIATSPLVPIRPYHAGAAIDRLKERTAREKAHLPTKQA